MAKKKTIKYPKNFEKLWEELQDWNYGNDHDGGLEYAIDHDYQLHAVSIWEGTGASECGLTAGINRAAEREEIKQLLDSADIFICPDCNHHGFYEEGELDEPPPCMGCGQNNMYLDNERKKK